jgi:hypothetical protein
MPHPVMYDDGDRHFQRVRALALALPEARMKVSHGRPAFYTQKVFAYYGGSVKGPAGTGGAGYVEHPRCVMVLPEEEDVGFLQQDPRAFRPAYLGAHGWYGIDLDGLDPQDDAGWDEVSEWLQSSFRLTAPARLARALDAG